VGRREEEEGGERQRVAAWVRSGVGVGGREGGMQLHILALGSGDS
jgi:hypothetical protein